MKLFLRGFLAVISSSRTYHLFAVSSRALAGCICAGGQCLSESAFAPEIAKCQTCTLNSQCVGDPKGCLTGRTNRCQTCTEQALAISFRACIPGEQPAARPAPVSQPAPADQPASAGQPAPGTQTPPVANGQTNNATANPCISTAWLKERNLEHAAIRHADDANVMCIPGLPCGTPGHILRECSSGRGKCKLVTYREACEGRPDCIESTVAVSQLNNAFDWSSYRSSTVEGVTLELTSLSAHPHSKPWSPSRLIANVADHLNSIGLGSICNALAVFPHRFRSTFDRVMLSKLSSAILLLERHS